MRGRTTFSLNSIPENYALSFASITTDFDILQETKRETNNIVSYMFVVAFILMISCIIGLSMTISSFALLIFPMTFIICVIGTLIYAYCSMGNEINNLDDYRDYPDHNRNSITVIVIDDENEIEDRND